MDMRRRSLRVKGVSGQQRNGPLHEDMSSIVNFPDFPGKQIFSLHECFTQRDIAG
jgi:hypothetical protein